MAHDLQLFQSSYLLYISPVLCALISLSLASGSLRSSSFPSSLVIFTYTRSTYMSVALYRPLPTSLGVG